MQLEINKQARVNFSKANKIARALLYDCLFQIAREKSCDYLLIIYKQQFMPRVGSLVLVSSFLPLIFTASLTCLFVRDDFCLKMP